MKYVNSGVTVRNSRVIRYQLWLGQKNMFGRAKVSIKMSISSIGYNFHTRMSCLLTIHLNYTELLMVWLDEYFSTEMTE